MRIIAGSLKGRKFAPVAGRDIRPTSAKVREALFSILHSQGRIQDARVLDLFAGVGAMGMEAISRGAASAVFVDKGRQAVDLVKKNLENFQIQDQASVLMWDVERNLSCLFGMEGAFDLVFADPPYRDKAVEKVLRNLAQSNAAAAGALVVVEHGKGEDPQTPEGYEFVDQRRYGKTLVSFFEVVLQDVQDSDSE